MWEKKYSKFILGKSLLLLIEILCGRIKVMAVLSLLKKAILYKYSRLLLFLYIKILTLTEENNEVSGRIVKTEEESCQTKKNKPRKEDLKLRHKTRRIDVDEILCMVQIPKPWEKIPGAEKQHCKLLRIILGCYAYIWIIRILKNVWYFGCVQDIGSHKM